MIQANGQTDTIEVVHKLGEHLGGGIIFYVDEIGQHGLVAAPADQPFKSRWGEGGLVRAFYKSQGDINTVRIIAYNKARTWLYSNSAALLCDTSTLGGHSDWFLPAIDELEEMYNKQKVIGNFNAGDYCSSTESDNKN